MKKLFESRIFIAIVFFALGALLNQWAGPFSQDSSTHLSDTDSEERYAISPEEYDHSKMMDAIVKMHHDMMDPEESLGINIAGVEKREDDHFVYYDISLSENEKNRELKVEIKNGMISIRENSPHRQSQREFSIDSNLDESKAVVTNEKDRISIKIPKRS